LPHCAGFYAAAWRAAATAPLLDAIVVFHDGIADDPPELLEPPTALAAARDASRIPTP
jgi:dienelactone hydrolase